MIIWKLTIGPYADNRVEIEAPKGAKILKIANQRDKICMWIQVDPQNTKDTEPICLLVMGTGLEFQLLNEKSEYLDTVFLYNAALVLHVYREYPEN